MGKKWRDPTKAEVEVLWRYARIEQEMRVEELAEKVVKARSKLIVAEQNLATAEKHLKDQFGWQKQEER